MRTFSRRGGQTLLELIAATIVISVALVPALSLTRTVIGNTAELEFAEARLTLCISKIEEELAYTAATWDLTNQSGSMSYPGQNNLRFVVVKSDALADGGIPDSLAIIDATVWQDADADGVLDEDERRVRLTTKIAKIVTYQNQSGGG